MIEFDLIKDDIVSVVVGSDVVIVVIGGCVLGNYEIVVNIV